MTEYGVMSDFEINKAVAISLGFPCYYGDGSYTNGLGLTGAIVSGKNNKGMFMVGEFNPCNNPIDAWPIIVENRIGINPMTGDDGIPRGWLAKIEGVPSRGDDKPLRAAMIVFLMKLDRS